MTSFVVKRVGAALGIVVVLTFVMFFLQRISHTDPVHAMLGAGASPAAVRAEAHRLGLDRPLVDQYFSYLKGLTHLDFGTSYRLREPVSTALATYFPATMELTAYSLLFALVIALILGVGGAGKWKGAGVFRAIMLPAACIPPFLLAMFGKIVFYEHLNLLPAAGRISSSVANPPTGPTGFLTIDGLIAGKPNVTIDAFIHLLLPALCIALIPAISIGRILRSSIEQTMQMDHVRTARAKGLKERSVLLKHALRNSVGPALSMAGLQLGLMFAGVVVIEIMFNWPGVGWFLAQSIPQGDFPAIAGVTLVLSITYVAINAAVDVLQAVADPRIRV